MKSRICHSRWNQWRSLAWCGVLFSFGSAAWAAGQGVPGLMLTNQTLLSDGRGSFEVLVPSNGVYTLEISTDLKRWTFGFAMEATSARLPIVSPEPLTAVPRMFLRMRAGTALYADLNLHFYVSPGVFGSASTPPVTFPVGLNGYTAHLNVDYDVDFPEGTNVFFTGPDGSGLANAVTDQFTINTEENDAWYQSRVVSSPIEPPAGGWSVHYKGTNLTYTLPLAETVTHLVIPVPTVTVAGGALQHVAWVYRNPISGAAIAGAPSHVTAIVVQVDGNTGPGQWARLYESEELKPTVTSHALTAPVQWTSVNTLHLAYDDDLGNHYVISYQR